jgi:hypothetical protein
LLPVLVFLQGALLALGDAVTPVLAALHPVNGLLIFWLSGTMAARATRYVRSVAARPALRDLAVGRASPAR